MDPLFIGGLLVSALVGASIAALHAGRVVTPRVAAWTSPPPIMISAEFTDLLPHVQNAVRELGELGHEFGLVVVSPTSVTAPIPGKIVVGAPIAGNKFAIGTLASASVSAEFRGFEKPAEFGEIDKHALDQPELVTDASDVIDADDNGVIRMAYIAVDRLALENRDPKRVLKHELLHAIGYLHVQTALFGLHKHGEHEGEPRLGVVGRKTGHLMHPLYSKGGDDTEGLNVYDLLPDETDRETRKRERREHKAQP